MGSILIVGGDSLIGQAAGNLLECRGFSVIRTTRRSLTQRNHIYLDLGKPPRRLVLPVEKLHSIIFSASISSIDLCARYPFESRRVNVLNTIKIIDQLSGFSGQIVFLSSTAVFNGESPLAGVHDPQTPMTEYGKQKAEVENALLESNVFSTIIRLGKVISPQENLFCSWIQDLRLNKNIYPFYDLHFAPVTLDFVCNLLSYLVEERIDGVIHATGSENLTYTQASQWIASRIKADPGLVQPILGKERMPNGFFPRYATLSCPQWLSKLGVTGIESLATLNPLRSV